MLIEIKSRFSLNVLFSYECENNTVAITLAAAITAKANLYGANLRSADLRSANLRCADLRCADLYGANLYGANLRCADLYGANLRSADLRSADLGSADLRSADLRSADLRSANLRSADLRCADLRCADLYEYGKLTEGRPYFSIGPIGSRQDTLSAFCTDKGVFLRAGCFFGSVDEFRKALDETHSGADNVHHAEYRAALALVETHFHMWAAK